MTITAATELKLRDYQVESTNAAWEAWDSGMQRPAQVLPTGAGKTVIFSALARQFFEYHSSPDPTGAGRRVLILVHRDELADQTITKLRSIAPGLDIGKVKAADNEIMADVMVASVQTLARAKRMEQLLDAADVVGRIGLVIVDECHHAAAVSYRNILAALGCYEGLVERQETSAYGITHRWYEGTRAIGFTATLARGDGVGLGGVWEDVVYSRSVLWMISQGYLVDPKAQEIEMDGLNLGEVKTSGGDYTASSLGEALLSVDGPGQIARIVEKYASGRRTIVFTPTVACAAETVKALDARGIPAGAVAGSTPRDQRLEVYGHFRDGRIDVLVNCMVLTEGADFPMADCAVIARPTQSAPLFIQMVGRVLRPHPGKTDALVLNIAGSSGRISTLIDLDDTVMVPVKPGETLGEAYVRQEEHANRIENHSGNTAFLLKHRDLDLFTASAHVWLRTPEGVQFIPMPGGFIFLWPRPDGLWNVGAAPEKSWGTERWVVLHEGLTLGLAQAWAETEADERSTINGKRQASWRRTLAGKAIKAKAASVGVGWTGTPTQGELSDAIAIRTAARVFDPVVKRRKG